MSWTIFEVLDLLLEGDLALIETNGSSNPEDWTGTYQSALTGETSAMTFDATGSSFNVHDVDPAEIEGQATLNFDASEFTADLSQRELSFDPAVIEGVVRYASQSTTRGRRRADPDEGQGAGEPESVREAEIEKSENEEIIGRIDDDLSDIEFEREEVRTFIGDVEREIGFLEVAGAAATEVMRQVTDARRALERKLDELMQSRPSPHSATLNTYQDNPRSVAAAGEPVNLFSGGFAHMEVDFETICPGFQFVYARYYNNQNYTRGRLGAKWRHSFEENLVFIGDDVVVRTLPTGQTVVYRKYAHSYFESPTGHQDVIYQEAPGYWIVESDEGERRVFDTAGQLNSIKDKFDNTITLEWQKNLLRRAIDASGRVFEFRYGAQQLLDSVVGPDDRSVTYLYNLKMDEMVGTVYRHGQAVTQEIFYSYERGRDIRLSWNLRTINVGGLPTVENSYGQSGAVFNKLTSQTFGGGTTSFAYSANGIDDHFSQEVTVIDPEGRKSIYHFDQRGRLGLYTRVYRANPTNLSSSWVEEYFYDSHDNLVSSKRALAEVRFEYEYTPLGGYVRSRIKDRIVINSQRNSQRIKETYVHDSEGRLIRYISPKLAETVYVPNSMGQPITVNLPQVRHSNGAVLNPSRRYSYFPNGNLESFTDEKGLQTSIEYYATGPIGLPRLIKIGTGDEERTISYTYNDYGHVVSEEFSDGTLVEYVRDSFDRVIEVVTDGRTSESFVWNSFGGLEEKNIFRFYSKTNQTTSLTERYDYDAFGRVKEILYSSNLQAFGAKQFTYYSDGNVRTVVGPGSKFMSYEYDDFGSTSKRLVGSTASTSRAVTEYHHNRENGLLEWIKDPRGYVTKFGYDYLGRLVRIVDALGQETKRTYDDHNNVTSISMSDPGTKLQKKMRFFYNSNDHLEQQRELFESIVWKKQTWINTDVICNASGAIEQMTHNGLTKSWSYNQHGQVLSVTDSLGNSETLVRDRHGHVARLERRKPGYLYFVDFTRDPVNFSVEMRDIHGSFEKFHYDSTGLLREHLDSSGVTHEYEIDALGRLNSQVAKDSRGRAVGRVSLSYNAEWRNDSITGANNESYKYDFDNFGNVNAVVDPMGVQLFSRRFDKMGNLVYETNSRGIEIVQEFDGLNRLVKRVKFRRGNFAALKPIEDSFQYDAFGNLRSAISGKNLVKNVYNSRGQVEETSSNGIRARADYHFDGSIATIEYSNRARAEYSNTATGRTVRLTYPRRAYPYQLPTNFFEGQKDAQGFVSRALIAGKIQRDSDYDYLRRPMGCVYTDSQSGAQLFKEVVLRDLDNLTFYREQAGQAVHITNNAFGQTTKVYETTVLPQSEIDAFGVAKHEQVTATQLGQLRARLATHGLDSYEYDAAGSMAAKNSRGGSVRFNPNLIGQATTSGPHQLVWDTDGNLTDDGVFSYVYDHLSRLIRVTEKASHKIRYEAEYDALGRKCAEKIDGKKILLSYLGPTLIERNEMSSNATCIYLYGDDSRIPLAALGPTEATVHVTDGQGTVRAYLSATSGQMTKAEYDSFGARSFGTSPVTPLVTEFGFMGQRHVPGNLVDFGARHYHHDICRFTTPDPSGFNDGLDRYQFANNNPYSFIDYNGNRVTLFFLVGGFVLGVTYFNISALVEGNYDFGVAMDKTTMFALSASEIGAGIDLIKVGKGGPSAALIGGGIGGLFVAREGNWDKWFSQTSDGAMAGFGGWLVFEIGSKAVGPLAGGLGSSAIGQVLANRLGSGIGSATMQKAMGFFDDIAKVSDDTFTAYAPEGLKRFYFDMTKLLRLANNGNWNLTSLAERTGIDKGHLWFPKSHEIFKRFPALVKFRDSIFNLVDLPRSLNRSSGGMMAQLGKLRKAGISVSLKDYLWYNRGEIAIRSMVSGITAFIGATAARFGYELQAPDEKKC